MHHTADPGINTSVLGTKKMSEAGRPAPIVSNFLDDLITGQSTGKQNGSPMRIRRPQNLTALDTYIHTAGLEEHYTSLPKELKLQGETLSDSLERQSVTVSIGKRANARASPDFVCG